MAATLNSRLGRLLAAVVVVMGCAGDPGAARADLLVNRLSEPSTAGARVLALGQSPGPVSYQTRLDEEGEDETEPPAQAAPLSPWKALVLTLVIPPPILTSMAVSGGPARDTVPPSELPRNFTFSPVVKTPAYPGTS